MCIGQYTRLRVCVCVVTTFYTNNLLYIFTTISSQKIYLRRLLKLFYCNICFLSKAVFPIREEIVLILHQVSYTEYHNFFFCFFWAIPFSTYSSICLFVVFFNLHQFLRLRFYCGHLSFLLKN